MKKCKLGELIEFQRGYDLPKTKAILGKYKVITSNGIMTYHNEKKSGPSIVIGRSGTVGKPQLIEEDFWPHNTTLFVKDLKGNNIKYLYYLLISLNINKMKSGSNIPTLNRNHLHPLEIYAEVDVKAQEKIANILFIIDKKIEINNKINNELEQLSKTIYDYCFLQFDFPDENGNPYKTSGGKMVWNETLKREVPEGWEVKKVSEILNVITGKKDANFAVENGKYNFFTCANDISKCNEYEYEGKSVLIAGNGDFNVKYYNGKYNAYQRTYILVPEQEKYVGLIYQSAIRKIDSFRNSSNGSIVKFITKEDIENIEIIVPNNDKLVSTINSNLDLIQHLKNENEELKSLRDFLLPLLMNGQVTFKN